MIAKCAPKPAIPDPEPAAKKLPACLPPSSSAQEFAALLSFLIFTFGKIVLYAVVFIISRIALPNLVARSSE
jgi:hypothetical protein